MFHVILLVTYYWEGWPNTWHRCIVVIWKIKRSISDLVEVIGLFFPSIVWTKWSCTVFRHDIFGLSKLWSFGVLWVRYHYSFLNNPHIYIYIHICIYLYIYTNILEIHTDICIILEISWKQVVWNACTSLKSWWGEILKMSILFIIFMGNL